MASNAKVSPTDVGLLLIRVVLGASMVMHGWPKLFGGPEKWAKVGKAMAVLGVEFWPTFWGFMAGFAEAVGGLLVAIGLAFRPASALVAFTMLVAVLRHVDKGDDIGRWSHAAELGTVFFALLLIGPGRYALDRLLRRT